MRKSEQRDAEHVSVNLGQNELVKGEVAMNKQGIGVVALIMTVLAVVLATPVIGETIRKENNSTALNLEASWVGGVVPGSGDIAQFDSNVTSLITVSLGGSLTWAGINILNPNGGATGSAMNFNAGGSLTLGSDGITTALNQNFTYNNSFILGADQTWSIASGTTLLQNNTLTLGGYTLNLEGGGTRQFKNCTISGNGAVVIRGNTVFENAQAPSADISIRSGTLSWTSGSGSIRSSSMTLNGGTLSITGVSAKDLVETNANVLAVSGNTAVVTISPNSTKNTRLYSGSFARSAKGMVIFRGTGLGTNTLASLTSNSTSVVFGTAPDLVGAGGVEDSTTNSILIGAYGDVSTSGSGAGLMTYDSTYGLRLLKFTSEYTASIISGQSQLDNVRLVNTSGSGMITNTITADTTINSLSFNVTGVGANSGILITGDTASRQLTLNSGTIFARQAVTTAGASDSMILTNLTLNLNGGEGKILTYANGISNGNTPAPLYIGCAIVNDGGNGVTFGGSVPGASAGETILVGDFTNTYTGVTTINSGYLRLSRSGGAASNSIPGNLVINGGNLLKNSNTIADSSDVTINGGGLTLDNTTSSGNNGHLETIHTLTLNGGTVGSSGGANNSLTMLGDLIINEKELKLHSGGDLTVQGTTILAGGSINVNVSSVTTSTNAIYTLNQIGITNSASGIYTAIVFSAHASNPAGKLTIAGDVGVVNNIGNTNSVFIGSANVALANQGFIALNGTRTFNIGDGAAAVDLTITPVIANNGATVGGLTKAGAGVLELTGANVYTGPTAVSNGTLMLSGSLVSSVTVSSNAVFAGTGTVSIAGTALTVDAGGVVVPGSSGATGTLTVTGNAYFAAGAKLNIDAATGTDLLAVSGTVSGGVSPVSVITTNVVGNGPWKIMTASSITATFTASSPDLVLNKMAGNTELWLYRGLRGSVLIIQ